MKNDVYGEYRSKGLLSNSYRRRTRKTNGKNKTGSNKPCFIRKKRDIEMESKIYGRKVIRRKQYTKIGKILIIYTLAVFLVGFILGAITNDLVKTTEETEQQTTFTIEQE